MPDLLSASKELASRVAPLAFSLPVSHVYNPLIYAWKQYEQYISAYGAGPKKVLLLGMNPGPWGMAQTGIPFGEIYHVKNWLGITGHVDKPRKEHPKRPIEGLACGRSEVSGRRLWSFFADKFESAEAFFADYFVANYCPLVFMEETGRNRTPDKLKPDERRALFEACDDHLVKIVLCLRPEWLIGVGGFAEKRFLNIATALAGHGMAPKIGKILHPSPASPAANRGWAEAVEQQLTALGIL
jgi:single-strand selective monofunctional uracil DNA glycosylase